MKISNIKSVSTVVMVLVAIVAFPSCLKNEVVNPQEKIEQAKNPYSRRGLDEEYILQGGPKKKNGEKVQNGKVKIVDTATGIGVVELELNDQDQFSTSLVEGEYVLYFYENDNLIGISETIVLTMDIEVYVEI